jgi:hypothetical protein
MYEVQAKRWKHGWELHIMDVGVTQCRSLSAATQAIRDYLELLLGHELNQDDRINLIPV